MCGIVGVLQPSRSRRRDETAALLDAMCEPVRRRGPDDGGIWIDEQAGIGLGHRRLAVVDLSERGHQPMESGDGRWVLTFNGEVYDHVDLRAELERVGASWRGHSDTEVLLEAISRWGLERTLDRIDGMFAIGLWDRAERQLHLVRDRMGEKPLHHARLDTGEVVFGSSLDSLRAHPDLDAAVDRDALGQFLRYGYVPAPRTILAGVSKVEPGQVLTFDSSGCLASAGRYWSVLDAFAGPRDFAGTVDDAADRLDELLLRSVRRRLAADVPVGAFLSGGIDSSTVVAAAQATSSVPLRTFTVGSGSDQLDETRDAAAVAAHLGTDHTSLHVTAADALAALDGLGAVHDEPFGDPSLLPTLLVSELARRHVTVALSGDGGDELFGGYNRYVWGPALWARLSKLPIAVRRAAARALALPPPTLWDRGAGLLPRSRRPRQLGLKVAKVAESADASSPQDLYGRLVTRWDAPALVRGAGATTALPHEPSRWPSTGGFVESMVALDASTYLPDDVLAKVDRASMYVGLEARLPLLDRHIVELAASLPVDLLVSGGTSKPVLRRLLHRRVPAALVDRPKAGFGLPIDEWLRGPMRAWAEERLESEVVDSFLDPAPILHVWQQHLAGRRDDAYRLWPVLMFVEWCAHRGVTA